MADSPTDVLIAAYQDIDAASGDYEALAALVKDGGWRSKGHRRHPCRGPNENLLPGSAGVIVVFDDEQRLDVEQALPGPTGLNPRDANDPEQMPGRHQPG